jgi:nitric oxide reductase NorQ protein
MTTKNEKVAQLIANNINVANMSSDEIDSAYTQLIVATPAQAPQAPVKQRQRAPVNADTSAVTDIDAIAQVMMQNGLGAFKTAIQTAIDTATAATQDQLTATIDKIDALTYQAAIDSDNAAADLKQAKAQVNTVQKDNHITRTVHVDTNGDVIAPKIAVNFLEYRKACDLWPELPASADYIFPVCDYTDIKPKFYDMTAVHNSGALRMLALSNKVSDTRHHMWLNGESGTGKSSLYENVAATCGRPFFKIGCDASTIPEALVGQFVIPDGKSIWQDGILTQALKTEYAVLCLDELDKAPAVGNFLQPIMDCNRMTIDETGEVVHFAVGMSIGATGNTSGQGDNTGRFDDTAVLNTAIKERFAFDETIEYMDYATECNALRRATSCSDGIAHSCCDIAERIRGQNDIEQPISFRRLLALAYALNAGIPVAKAFESSVYKFIRNDSDQESYRALVGVYFPTSFTNTGA